MNDIIAVCPGSFDPVTVGHIDIISRAAQMFSEVVVVVMHNPSKSASFTVEERVEMIELATADLKNVRVDSFEGLLADYTKKIGAGAIVKGLRAMSDFEYEFQMALVNKDLCYNAETVFLAADVVGTFLSSSMVKQIAMLDGDISSYVPHSIEEDIKKGVKSLRKDK